jgi:hypothetical protein
MYTNGCLKIKEKNTMRFTNALYRRGDMMTIAGEKYYGYRKVNLQNLLSDYNEGINKSIVEIVYEHVNAPAKIADFFENDVPPEFEKTFKENYRNLLA